MAAIPNGLVRSGFRKGYRSTLKSAAQRVLRPEKVAGVLARVDDPLASESYPWRRVTESVDDHLRGLVLEYSLPRLLRYEDRNSMAFSVEARVPFTDYRIVEFAFSPALRGLKLKHGWAKWCLRKAATGLAPDGIVWRRDKMGFGTPEHDFVRHLIQSFGKDLTACGVAEDFLDPQMVRETMQEAASGRDTNGSVLRAFRCMVFNSWARQFPLK
jgi:asparagine synthase (glutamine-hydrolysing)